MRSLLRRTCTGIAALVIFQAILGGLYRYILPEWYEDAVLFGGRWSIVFAAPPVIIALIVAGAVWLFPTWLALRRSTL